MSFPQKKKKNANYATGLKEDFSNPNFFEEIVYDYLTKQRK